MCDKLPTLCYAPTQANETTYITQGRRQHIAQWWRGAEVYSSGGVPPDGDGVEGTVRRPSACLAPSPCPFSPKRSPCLASAWASYPHAAPTAAPATHVRAHDSPRAAPPSPALVPAGCGRRCSSEKGKAALRGCPPLGPNHHPAAPIFSATNPFSPFWGVDVPGPGEPTPSKPPPPACHGRCAGGNVFWWMGLTLSIFITC